MKIRELSTGAPEPVTVDELKEHLRLFEDSDLDSAVAAFKGARAYAEGYSGKTFVRRQFRQSFDHWPNSKRLELDRQPLALSTAVVVKYYAENSTSATTLASSLYWVDAEGECPAVVLRREQSWPDTTLRSANGVEVTYYAGYSTSAEGVPEWAKAGIKLIGAAWYENREEFVVGTVTARIPLSARSLLGMYRTPKSFA